MHTRIYTYKTCIHAYMYATHIHTNIYTHIAYQMHICDECPCVVLVVQPSAFYANDKHTHTNMYTHTHTIKTFGVVLHKNNKYIDGSAAYK